MSVSYRRGSYIAHDTKMPYNSRTMLKQRFSLTAPFSPTGDQPNAIRQLAEGIRNGNNRQTLLGVTGSGKTFVAAHVIETLQRPALIISHNKTLAAQLASELSEFFPNNAVHYFVSYYDYYQPEAYVPRTDTYIGKETSINEEIDRLRHATIQALLSRRDVIVVASVSCIYGIGKPEDYRNEAVRITKGEVRKRNDLLRNLTYALYERNDIDFRRGTFRVRGDTVDIHPGGDDTIIRVSFFGDVIESLTRMDSLSGASLGPVESADIYPAKLYLSSRERITKTKDAIFEELRARLKELRADGNIVEAERLEQRTTYDMEMLETVGYVQGIENYSRHLDERKAGEPPKTLIDYFPKDFITFIDESHMTLPQIAAMHAGDRARKQTLIRHGFRLPSALDNRPLTIDEFWKRVGQTVFVSATPAKEETTTSAQTINLIVRPTGLLDPTIELHPTEHQIDHLLEIIRERITRKERVLITTLTKRMAEDLASYLAELDIKTHYIHSEVDTMDRLEILRDLRTGAVDVLVGINLLREGLDLPEVSLVAILDADKEGYLRSDTALIQVMGRAARHKHGHVVMYADRVTGSMRQAIDETNRRRDIQEAYNKAHNIVPRSVMKDVRTTRLAGTRMAEKEILTTSVPKNDVPRVIKELTEKMHFAAANLEFEKAAKLRDAIQHIREKVQ